MWSLVVTALAAPLARRAALRLATAGAAFPSGASAWCGNPFPPFAYSLPWFEFDASGCEIRIIGDLQPEVDKGLRPLVAVPSLGLSFEYLENLEALTITQRRVGFVALPASDSAERLTQALVAALGSLDAKRGVHLLAHGLAAPVALAAAAAAPPGTVASLILTSPVGCLSDVDPAFHEALAASPAPLLATAAAQGRVCVDAAVDAARKSPASAVAAAQRLLRGDQSHLTSISELVAATGASGVPTPLLLTRGDCGDVTSAPAMRAMVSAARARADGSSFVRFASFARSGPLPFVDEGEAFGASVLDFCDAVDGVTTRRVVVAGGDQRIAGRI